MWSPTSIGRRGRSAVAAAVLGALALALGACGFRPLYGSGGGASAAALAQIRIARIADRNGQKLRNLLLDRLTPDGPPARPRYVLQVSLGESIANLAIRKDESATRANLTLTASFTLSPVGAGDRAPFTGTAVSTNSYNVLTSDFATLSAENDARNRALRSIAEELRLRIATALANPAAFPRREAAPAPARR